MSNKVLFIYVLTIAIPISADNTFYFQAYKDPTCNYALSYKFLKSLKEIFNIDTFIETGTYTAETTTQAALVFEKVHTFELDLNLFNAAQKKLSNFQNVAIYHDDSGRGLRNLLPTIKGNLLFWLDAHYSGPGTTKINESGPLIDELRAIGKSWPGSVILIDDMPYFKSLDSTTTSPTNDLPHLSSIIKELKAININFEYALLRGILLIYDGTKFKLNFSPVVKACTANRLFFAELSDIELLRNDIIIGKAKDQELLSIQAMYNSTKGDMATYDITSFFWNALTLLEQRDYKNAYNIFNRIILSNQYNHWRARWHAAFCALNLATEYPLSTNFLEKVVEFNLQTS